MSASYVKIKEVVFEPKAEQDYYYWRTHNADLLRQLEKAIVDVCSEPFFELPVLHESVAKNSGYWSRSFSAEHALVYSVRGETLIICHCRNCNVANE